MDDGAREEYRSLRAEISQNDRLIQGFHLGMVAFLAVAATIGISTGSDSARAAAAFALLVATVAYLHLVLHKIEGIVRIATYLSVFHERPGAGTAWENRMRALASDGAERNTPDPRKWIWGSSVVACIAITDKHLPVLVLASLAAAGYGIWREIRSSSLRGGYLARWERVSSGSNEAEHSLVE